MLPTTQKAALKVLWGSDHAFLSPRMAETIAGLFPGASSCVYEEEANNGEFKGLVTTNGKKERVRGASAHDLANSVARSLDPEFRNPMMGRGSALRFACEHIEKRIG